MWKVWEMSVVSHKSLVAVVAVVAVEPVEVVVQAQELVPELMWCILETEVWVLKSN
jgi:hypothetical protein